MPANVAPVTAGQVSPRIRDSHVSVVSAINGAIDNVVTAGKLLIDAKKSNVRQIRK
jgi:hypothetical protein